jgi:hypothetical protein
MWPATAGDVRGPRASELVALHSTPHGENPVPVLRQWGMDRIGWGLPPQRQQEVDSWAKAWVAKHRSAGVRYHAVLNLSFSNGYLTGPQPELLATRCLGPDGQFIGPRHSGVLGTINGQPTWYHCIHHPLWRQYLRDALGYSLAAGAQGIEFDSPLANGNADSRQDGTCFCGHCLAAFEKSAADLPMRGDALKAHLAGQAKTQAKATTDPLLVRYYAFQVESAARLLRELVAHGRDLHPDAEFSANSYDLLPESLAAAAACDSLLTEVSHYAELWNEATVPRSLAWRYRLPDALGRRLVASATLWEWRYLQDHQCEDLLKLWFAAAYAHGHLYVVPNLYQWSGKTYRGSQADFAPMLRFVKDHARLLDDYTHAPAALVLYSPDDLSAIGGSQAALHRIMGIAEALAYRQADFDFAIAQNRFFEAPAWPQRPLLIVPEGLKLSAADQTRVEEYAKTGKLMRWPRDQARVDALREVQAPAGLWIKVRLHRSDPSRRVLHVLNGQFDYKANRVQSKTGQHLRFPLPEGWPALRATWHTPGRESQSLPVSIQDELAELTLPHLEHWGIVELSSSDQP